jgi:hypothetical protein
MKFLSIQGNPGLIETFCKLPSLIYSEEDKRSAMNELQCQKLLALPIPFEKEGFLLQSDSGAYRGRILFQASSLKHLGHWSFLALAPDLNSLELEELDAFMKDWFTKREMSEIIGPYFFTTYFPYRMRADRDPVSYPWEPKQPFYELEMMKKMDHQVHATYFSNLLVGFGHFETKGKKEYEALLQEGFTFRPIRTEKLEEEIKILYDLSMAGFVDNYLFEPIPFELFKEVYVPSFKAVDLRMSCVQYSPEGKPVGFNFTFPQGHLVIIKSACVLPDFRGKGLFSAGIYHGVLKTRELCPQVTDAITALVHEDNLGSKHVANSPTAQERHEYVLLSKDFKL